MHETYKGMKKKNKISKGLNRLLNSKEVNHFVSYTGHFIQGPHDQSQYLNRFTEAQLLEIAR